MSQFHRRVALEAVCFGPAPHSVSFRDCCPQDAGFVGGEISVPQLHLGPSNGITIGTAQIRARQQTFPLVLNTDWKKRLQARCYVKV